MKQNIIEKYIDIVKEEFKTYMKLIYENKYENKIFEEYFKKYIECRYYNYYENKLKNNLRQTIIENLKDTQNKMLKKSDKDIIVSMCVFFYYMLYFDNIIKSKDINKTIEKIAKLKERILGKEISEKKFQQTYLKQNQKYVNLKKELMEKYKTEEFYLKLSNYKGKSNVIRVNLKHNIKIPEIYSEMAIHKTFNEGIINEDKLYVEYNLLSLTILEEIQKQNFKKEYIAEFADSLLDKPRKLKNILQSIESPILQEKISLKIKYSTYIQKSEIVNELLRNGYKVAIVLDNTFEINFANIEKLKLFSYTIINKESNLYETIMQYKIENLIET